MSINITKMSIEFTEKEIFFKILIQQAFMQYLSTNLLCLQKSVKFDRNIC